MNQSTGYSWDIMYPRDDLTQTAHQAFERILYVYKTENTPIRRLLDGRVFLGFGAT